jgi:hypothetical protein
VIDDWYGGSKMCILRGERERERERERTGRERLELSLTLVVPPRGAISRQNKAKKNE